MFVKSFCLYELYIWLAFEVIFISFLFCNIRFLPFVLVDCVKFVARRHEISKVLVIMDSWKSGTRGDRLIVILAHQIETEDVFANSHYVTC